MGSSFPLYGWEDFGQRRGPPCDFKRCAPARNPSQGDSQSPRFTGGINAARPVEFNRLQTRAKPYPCSWSWGPPPPQALPPGALAGGSGVRSVTKRWLTCPSPKGGWRARRPLRPGRSCSHSIAYLRLSRTTANKTSSTLRRGSSVSQSSPLGTPSPPSRLRRSGRTRRHGPSLRHKV